MRKCFSVIASTVIQGLVLAALIVSPMIVTEGVPRLQRITKDILIQLPDPPRPPNPYHDSAQPGGRPHSATDVPIAPRENRNVTILTPDPTAPIELTEPGPPMINTEYRTSYADPSAHGKNVICVGPCIPSDAGRVSGPPPAERGSGSGGGGGAVAAKPIPIGGSVIAARAISRPQPIYPPIALQVRQQGTVRLEAIISRSGAIEELRLISGPPLLIEAALSAVRQWRYQPTMLNGQAVEVITTIDVTFTLSQ
jgi:protein TonB